MNTRAVQTLRATPTRSKIAKRLDCADFSAAFARSLVVFRKSILANTLSLLCVLLFSSQSHGASNLLEKFLSSGSWEVIIQGDEQVITWSSGKFELFGYNSADAERLPVTNRELYKRHSIKGSELKVPDLCFYGR